jgi:hypothetical protein
MVGTMISVHVANPRATSCEPMIAARKVQPANESRYALTMWGIRGKRFTLIVSVYA